MSLAELKEKYRKHSALEKARSGWEEEYNISSKQVTVIAWVIGGKCVFLVFYPIILQGMHNAYEIN